MMKKILFLSLLLVASLVIADDQAAKAESPKNYYDVLPAETLVVVSIPQMEELKALIASPEVEGALIETGLKKQAMAMLEAADAEFANKTKMSLFDIYDDLGGSLTFALLDMDFAKKDGSFAMIVGMKGGKAMVDAYLTRLVAAAKEHGKELAAVDVAGVKMLSMDDRAYMGSWGDSLLVVNGQSAVSALMDKSPRLSQHPYFKLNSAHTVLNSGVVAYMNFEGIYKKFAPSVADPQAQLGFKLLGLDKILSMSLNVPLQDDGLMRMLIHAPGYDGIIPMVFSAKGVGGHAASVTADHADFMYAISIHKPLQIFESFLALIPEIDPNFDRAAFDANLAAMEETMGINMRNDLLAPMGEYLSMAMYLDEDIDVDLSSNPMALLSILKFDLGFELADQGTFIKTMDILTEQAGGAIIPEPYKDAVIYAISAPGMPVEACATIYNNQLKFCLYSSEMAKQLVDKIRTGQTLASFANYKETVKPVPANSNAYAFQSRNYISKWSAVGSSFGQMLTPEQKASIQNLIDKSRELSKSFPDLYSYSQVIPEGLYVQSQYPIKKVAQYLIIELMKYQSIFEKEKFDHQADTGRGENNVDLLADPR